MTTAGNPRSGPANPPPPPAAGPVLARGVSSGARSRREPLVLRGARGAEVLTMDGRRLVDYMLGMGPVLLGHGRPEVLARVTGQLPDGTLYGTTPHELELAERLSRILPHAERVAFVSTGSEATHLAIRIACAGTGRRVIVKFEGHYHGWIDPLFLNTQNNPPGAPDEHPVHPHHGVAGLPAPADVIVARWNDRAEIDRIFDEHGPEIAGVILEPIPMNFGAMMPDPGYAEHLRDACTRNGTVLIYDEVLTGFRMALGGAAELLGVRPDIAVYAKAVANGFPIAVVAGTDAAMDPIVRGPVVPAGTYSGNAISVVAALATLDVLEAERDRLYPALADAGAALAAGIGAAAESAGVPLRVNQIGSVLQMFWGVDGPIRSYADAARSDRAEIAALSEDQLGFGSMVSPRGLILLSAAHERRHLDTLVDGIARRIGAA